MLKLKPGKLPIIRVNEGSPLRPLILSRLIEHADEQTLKFTVTQKSGDELPLGLVCQDGKLMGQPEEGTAKDEPYELLIHIESDVGNVDIDLSLYIHPAITEELFTEKHKEAWKKLAKAGAVPDDLRTLINRPFTKQDLYYLLDRYASFTIWNAEDLRLAEHGKIITLDDASEHFTVYDFEVCLVTTPKDLFDPNRILSHGQETACAMAREAYKRKWQVEFGGFDKLANAAWYEVFKLNKSGEFKMEIRNYQPNHIKSILTEPTKKPG